MRRLQRPDLAPVVDELARRFGDGDTPASVTLRGLSAAQRAALADLLGSDRLLPPDTRVRVEALTRALGLGGVHELRDVIERLRGRLPDRRAERAARRSARDALWRWLAAEAATVQLGGDPSTLTPWVEEQRAAGVRGDPETHRRRLASALAVLRALPAAGTTLAGLASDHTGDPHALDHGRALATTVLDAVAVTAGTRRPPDAEGTRALWEVVGVAPDPVSSTVLALGLPGGSSTPLDQWLSATADASEPVVLSLANLRRWPLAALPAAARLYVVENPSLLVEAAASRWNGPPLVCSSGRPTVATVTMLRQLCAAGARAFQHADFDAAGLGITHWLTERAGTIPWRMGASDYLRTVRARRSHPPFVGAAPATPWDPALREAVERERSVVYEEELRADLLDSMRVPMA